MAGTPPHTQQHPTPSLTVYGRYATATAVIDAAVAEYGPDLMDADPSRRTFHSTWNKGMKRGD